jgi:hypothetical protein
VAEPASGTRSTDRFLIGIVVGSVALVVLGVLVVLLAGRNQPARAADPSSPVGVVDAYLEALRAGDADRAYGYLSRAAQASTPRDRYLERFPRFSPPSQTSTRVLIEPVSAEGDSAEVKVTVSRFNSGGAPFSTNTYHQDYTIRLVREDGAWKIAQPVEPYAFIY